MDEGKPSGGSSPNGTSNDSTGSSTQSNSNPAKTDTPTPKKKSSKRSIEVVITERVNRVVASAADYASDRMVAAALEDVSEDRIRFERMVGAPVEAKPVLTARSSLKKDSKKIVLATFVVFSKCVGATPQGKDFLAKVRGKNQLDTARNAIAQISPQILRHNKPLLDDLVAALADYDRVSEEYDQHVGDEELAKQDLSMAIKRLRLSLQGLEGAVKIAASNAARSKLPAPKKSKHVKVAA